MTTDIIGTDKPLTAVQRDTLNAVSNLIIPPSADGRMPSAADTNVLAYIIEWESNIIPALVDELDRLDSKANDSFGTSFTKLAQNDRQALIEDIRATEPRFMADFFRQTVVSYYQDDRVLEALGMEARAPFPEGYEVKSGDLSLLDPVRERGKAYRDVDDS